MSVFDNTNISFSDLYQVKLYTFMTGVWMPGREVIEKITAALEKASKEEDLIYFDLVTRKRRNHSVNLTGESIQRILKELKNQHLFLSDNNNLTINVCMGSFVIRWGQMTVIEFVVQKL